jgi:hypothetical protein
MVLAGIGFFAFAGIVPVKGPNYGTERLVQWYVAHDTGIRAGMVFLMIAMGLIVPWGMALATQARRAAPQHPILFHIQVACVATAMLLGIFVALTGAIAAYRPGSISPDITQTLHDVWWFLWVFAWSYFMVWNFAVAASILVDRREDRIFPRWAGYLSAWIAFGYTPASLVVFFKSGPFAYNGIMTWWLPTLSFFTWMAVMTGLTIRAIGRQPEPATRSPRDDRDLAARIPDVRSQAAA